MDLRELTALELGALLRSGEVTCAQAAAASRAAIAAAQPDNNAFLTVAEGPAPAPDLAASPLAGVPMAYKDNICTKGMPTTCASKILGNFTPCYDAAAAERLRRAGAVSMGKLNMDEFAMGSTSETSFYGPAAPPAGRRRPWRRGRCGTPSARIPAALSASRRPTAASPA